MNNLILICLILFPAMASANLAQFGRVVEVKGSGFVSNMGKTHEVKKGEILYLDSEIVVESSGQITFTDNADHRFHLGHSSSAALYNSKVELRSGDLWVQSINKIDSHSITTANAEINYTGGESIISYDSLKGKTQVMVINGMMKLSNLRAPELNLNVAEGNFSFVDLNYEEGMPRDPTPVGEKTYKELVALFNGVGPMDSHSADIFKDQTKSVAHGKVVEGNKETETNIKKTNDTHELNKEVAREIASITVKANEAKSRNVKIKDKRMSAKSKKVINNGLIQIYGLNSNSPISSMAIYDMPKTEGKRAPASVTEAVTEEVVPGSLQNNTTTQESPQYKECEKLIESLKKL